MTVARIYGIKNCDTIRKTKRFLDDNGIAYQFIDMREQPLTQDEVEFFIHQLGLDKLINRHSTTYRALSDKQKQTLDSTLIITQPTLIKRPLIVHDGSCFVGYDEVFLRTLS